MNKPGWAVRLGLFGLILGLGTLAALIVGGAPGLALAELSGAPVQALAGAARADVLVAALGGEASSAGIYRSDDRGITWQPVGPGPGGSVRALAVHAAGETSLVAASRLGMARLWRSDDAGRTWQVILPGRLPEVTALAVVPGQPHGLVVGTAGQGLFRVDTEQGHYQRLGGAALSQADVKLLAVASDGRVYAQTQDGLFASQGAAWKSLPVPEMAASLALDPHDPQTLYAGGVSTGIFRSTDGGRSWQASSQGLGAAPGAALRVTALAVDEEQPGHLVAAVAYGLGNQFAPGDVYESRDAGQSWTSLGRSQALVSQLVAGQGVVYAAGPGGLARYGNAIGPSALIRPRWRSLASPNGLQVLILALTLALAGLALMGRTGWLIQSRARTIQS